MTKQTECRGCVYVYLDGCDHPIEMRASYRNSCLGYQRYVDPSCDHCGSKLYTQTQTATGLCRQCTAADERTLR